MRVHLIKAKTVMKFACQHPGSKNAFINWLISIRYANWDKPEDILSTFSTADILGQRSRRVVFNIGGNNFRLIAKYHFGVNQVHIFVKWIGSHTEYDELCNQGKQYCIDAF
jgi:mRNA interferase HigB